MQQEKNKPIIASIREYVLACPFLKGGKVNIDYLPDEMAYSVDPIGGKCIRQFPFSLTSKEAYDGDARTGIENSGFYQYFEEWVEQNNMNDILPELEGHTPIRVDVLLSGFLFSMDAEFGRYQLQCRLIYE